MKFPKLTDIRAHLAQVEISDLHKMALSYPNLTGSDIGNFRPVQDGNECRYKTESDLSEIMLFMLILENLVGITLIAVFTQRNQQGL